MIKIESLINQRDYNSFSNFIETWTNFQKNILIPGTIISTMFKEQSAGV